MNKFTSSLRIFFSGAWLSYTALFSWTTPNSYIACKIFLPITQMLFFVYLGVAASGRDAINFYIVGNAIQMVAINGIYGVTEVVGVEREIGTLIYLLGSPANRAAVFLGRALFNILDGITTVIICFLWGVLLGLDLSHTDFVSLAIIIAVTAFSTCGFGLLLGSLSLLSVNIMFLNNTIYFLLLVFSGANLPLEKMPVWIQMIRNFLPLSRGIQSARLLVDGKPINEIWPIIIGELTVGIVYALLGLTLFYILELQARRSATLEVV